MGRLLKNITLVVLACISPFALAALDKGDTPPDYLGRNKDRNKVYLSAFKGKVVIISFWATWCPPCQKEIPILEGIQKKIGTAELQVVMVNVRDSYRNYRALTGALAGDVQSVITYDKGMVRKKFDVDPIPHMILVDRRGKVVAEHVGYSDEMLPGLIREVADLLAAPVAGQQ